MNMGFPNVEPKLLPDKQGYIVRTIDGVTQYVPNEYTLREMQKTERIAELESENETLKEQVTNLEDCILEIADVVYA